MDIKELGVWEPFEVKAQTIKTAVESATLLLRIDDIVSGMQKKNKMAPGQSQAPQVEDPDAVGVLPSFMIISFCKRRFTHLRMPLRSFYVNNQGYLLQGAC